MESCLEIMDTEAWLRDFRGRAARGRIPFTAYLELTRRCNLRCRHCYLGSQEEQHQNREAEQDTIAVKKSLDEWAAAGCFHLVITGGDPMMRDDFCEIYRHGVELGMFTTVFCDGILVTDRIIDLFREYPPRSVEISIYGATAPVYESVTRVEGSYALAWRGIRRLVDAGVRVALKTVLLTLNQHELAEMAVQAEALGCLFRFDAAVFPCIAAHPSPPAPLPAGEGRPAAGAQASPTDLRVAPEVVVQWDLAFPERRSRLARAIKVANARPVSENVYACGAGNTSFYVDPFGNFSPCLMTTQYRYPADGRSFDEIWHGDLLQMRRKKRVQEGGCLTGPMRGICTHCPASNYLETGNEENDSDYMRKTTELRYAAILATDEYKENT